MICFCAERFHWRRIWQNPGELLIPGIADMATRALLYLRAFQPSSLFVEHRAPNFYGLAAPAPAWAALYLAHSSQRPRSDPDHAAARHHRRRQGFRAAPWRLDRRASRPIAEGGALSSGHRGAAARYAAPDRASRRRARHGVGRNARE